MKKRCYLNHAMQEGLFFLLLSGWLLGYSLDAHSRSYIRDWAQSPSLFPVIAAGLLALLGMVIFIQGIRECSAERPAAHGHPLKVILLLGMTAAYYAALSVIRLPYMTLAVGPLTFTLSTFELVTVLFLAAMMFALGVRKLAALTLVPLCTSAFLSVMFRTLLHVLLP